MSERHRTCYQCPVLGAAKCEDGCAYREVGMALARCDVAEALRFAQSKHKPMNSPHEGYAVILEELDELWDEVKAQKPDRERMRKEALQVAAMGLRFVVDLCALARKGESDG